MQTNVLRKSRASDAQAVDFGPGPQLQLYDVVVFLVPMFIFLKFQIGGDIFASEVLLLFMLPALLIMGGGRLFKPLPLKFLVLGLLWLASQIVTDLVRDSSFHDASRGWAKIAFTLLNFCSLYLLIDGRARRIVLFAAGLSAGQILGFYFAPNIYSESDPWKFGLGSPVTLAIILLGIALNRGRSGIIPVWTAAFPAAAALLNLYLGYRSLAAFCFIAAGYTVIASLLAAAMGRDSKKARLRLFALMLGLVASAWGFSEVYSRSAQSGLLGADERAKFETQRGDLGILLGGRSEIFSSGAAIQDSLLLGHGSWARDSRYEFIRRARGAEYGYKIGASADDLIATHSFIFGAWVEAGVMGALFWLWVFILPLRVLSGMARQVVQIAPLIAFLSVGLIWAILFSPFGADERVFIPYSVVVMLASLVPAASMVSRRAPLRAVVRNPAVAR